MPPRKSKIPFGTILLKKSGVPRLSKFNISKVRWKTFETAWGHVFPEKARQEINTAMKRALLLAKGEHSTPDLSESIERIRQWQKAADDFLAALKAPGNSTSIYYAEFFVQQEFAHITTLDDLHDIVMAFRGACVRAPDEATKMAVPGGPRRQASDTLIKDLATIFARHGWRPTARRDFEARTKPSPFVSFVWELQKLMPSKYRRATTKEALAKEINLALSSGPERARRSKE
jgi:hypothetical protein